MRLNLHTLPIYQDQFALVETRFLQLFENPAAFQEIVARGLKFMHAPNADSKVELIKSNFFSEELLQAMICGGAPYKTSPIHYIWGRLIEHQIVIRATGHMPGAFVDHHLVLPLLLEHLRANTLANIFAPPSAIINRYADAIVAIDVETASGNKSRGTGFFAAPNAGPTLLYTCKHNVDPESGIKIMRITTAGGKSVEFGETLCHVSEDIAVIAVRGFDPPEPYFRFRSEVDIFDEVYTLGYPKVPCAETKVVGHRGEVNGSGKLYLGGSDIILISNLVSPGNSGGPLLDRDGFCIGMSIKWLEGEWEGERARFSAALPASLLELFGG